MATPVELCAPELPGARGPVTEALFSLLRGPVEDAAAFAVLPEPVDDPLSGPDSALALYVAYELHFRGFRDVDDGWEWHPQVMSLVGRLERRLLAQVRQLLVRGGVQWGAGQLAAGQVPAALEALTQGDGGPSLSRFLMTDATADQMREFAVHRSAYQLKEADPHTFAIPRLAGRAKAALVEIQADEYGGGVERDMHQNLFAVTMAALGLDTRYGVYVDRLPALTLSACNVMSLFALHRRWRGALVGHLALFEMTSVEPMGRCSAALRRLGFGAAARHFYDVHVVADAHHEQVAAFELAGALAEQEPALIGDILFGSRAAMLVEGLWAAEVLGAWSAGRSSLLTPLEVAEPVGAPVRRSHELSAVDAA